MPAELMWLFQADPHGDPGTIRVTEAGPDGIPAEVELYPVPLAALALVAPNQTLGLTMQELAGAAPEAQRQIMGAWFRANYQPGSFDDFEQFAGESYREVPDQLRSRFWDPRSEATFAGSAALAEELQNEAPIWVQKLPQTLDARPQNALRALDELEAVIRRGQSDTPGRDHNRPPEPLDGSPATLDNSCRDALVAIEVSRRELRAERPSIDALRRSAQTIIKLARVAGILVGHAAQITWPTIRKVAVGAVGMVVADAYANGSDAATAHVIALWQTGVKAAMALQAYIGN